MEILYYRARQPPRHADEGEYCFQPRSSMCLCVCVCPLNNGKATGLTLLQFYIVTCLTWFYKSNKSAETFDLDL